MLDVLDLHTHTVASGHAYNTIYEMARSAAEKGVQLLGISDHGPAMDGGACPFYFRSSRKVPRTLFGIRIMFGVEFNIVDYHGKVDLEPIMVEPVDFGIASLHDVCITPGSAKENTNAYIHAMENPKVHIIGHPDDATFAVDYPELVKAAAEHHVLLEVNEASVNPHSYRKGGRENAAKLLALCQQYGVSVILASDAHIEYSILDHQYGLSLLEECHFPEELVVNRSVDALTAALNAKG